MHRPAFFAHADSYLVDVKFGIIVDVIIAPQLDLTKL
jgi:hypothetical protein